MLFHIKIVAQVLAMMLLPYLLIGGLMRVFIPKAKPWRLSLLSTLLTLFADSHLHFFMSPVQMDRVMTHAFEGALHFCTGLENFSVTAKALSMTLLFIPSLSGAILVPLLLARGGVAIVDRIRNTTGPNRAMKATS